MLLLMTLIAGCQPEAASPPAGPASTAPHKANPPSPATVAAVHEPLRNDDKAAAPRVGEPSLCVASCVLGSQPQTGSPEEIERGCGQQCDEYAKVGTPEACTAAAEALRERVEKVRARDRAPALWAGLGKPEVHCGRADPALLELASRGSTVEWAGREGPLLGGLLRDPLLQQVCPAGVTALEAVDEEDGVSYATFFIEACPLAGLEVKPVHKDLPALAFLAIEVVRARWAALHIDSDAHARLLDTLTLATALEASMY